MTWQRERTPCGVVEYARESPRRECERTSYVVSSVHGLLLGRVWREWHPARLSHAWRAGGWTPRTSELTLGPFQTRWEAFEALLAIEGPPHASREWSSLVDPLDWYRTNGYVCEALAGEREAAA